MTDTTTTTFHLRDLVRLKQNTGFEGMPAGTVCVVTKIESGKNFRYLQVTSIEGHRAWVQEHNLEPA